MIHCVDCYPWRCGLAVLIFVGGVSWAIRDWVML